MPTDDFDTRVASIAALGEPVRRALYHYVVTQDGPVSRDQAAHGVNVARHVAKFHLDKLEEDGLLVAEFSRPPGRGGPGAGRPSKLYRRSSHEWSVSLPERRYDLAGRLLAQAISTAERGAVPVADALRQAATDMGRSLGEEARLRAGAGAGEADLLATVRAVLDEYGYEPRADAACITLANCPFHALARDYTDLVCGMNLDLLRGLVGGLQTTRLEARLDPAPDRCCVTISRN